MKSRGRAGIAGGRRRVDHAAVKRAVRELLAGLGLDPDDAELGETPSRVASAWGDELLDGYDLDPRELLAEASDAEPGCGLVIVAALPFRSMCPHHLLPSYGRATVGYLPDRRLAGFSAVARLLDCHAHRLTLQEHVAREVATSLVELLPARGAGCVIEATQLCLSARGAEDRPGARVLTQSFAGELSERPELQAQLLQAARGGGHP